MARRWRAWMRRVDKVGDSSAPAYFTLGDLVLIPEGSSPFNMTGTWVRVPGLDQLMPEPTEMNDV